MLETGVLKGWYIWKMIFQQIHTDCREKLKSRNNPWTMYARWRMWEGNCQIPFFQDSGWLARGKQQLAPMSEPISPHSCAASGHLFINVPNIYDLVSLNITAVKHGRLWLLHVDSVLNKCNKLFIPKNWYILWLSRTQIEIYHDDVIKWKHFPRYWPFMREFTGQRWIPLTRPVTRSFDVFFDPRRNKWLSKQWGRRLIETPSCTSWRSCNDTKYVTYCHGINIIWEVIHPLTSLYC